MVSLVNHPPQNQVGRCTGMQQNIPQIFIGIEAMLSNEVFLRSKQKSNRKSVWSFFEAFLPKSFEYFGLGRAPGVLIIIPQKSFSCGRKFADLKKFSKNREKIDHVGCQNWPQMASTQEILQKNFERQKFLGRSILFWAFNFFSSAQFFWRARKNFWSAPKTL